MPVVQTSMNRRAALRTTTLGDLGVLTAKTAFGKTRAAGANERIRVGIVAYSDRFVNSLLPAFLSLADELNCDFVGVSDLWSVRTGERVTCDTKAQEVMAGSKAFHL